MGIAQADLHLLIELRKLGHIRTNSSVIEIGAQQLTNSFMSDRDSIEEIAGLFGVTEPFPLLQPLKTPWTIGRMEGVSPESPLSKHFWKWLQFRYLALDIDGSEDSIALDLNFDSVPETAKGQFEVVTNFGTTEHVANQINAFKMIHEFVCHNGLMIHNVPGYGMLDHGLITYNPKFFWMLGRSNGYKIIFMNYQLNDVPYSIPGDIVDYLQGFQSTVSHERLRSRKVFDGSLVVVMQKQFDIDFVPPIDTNTGSPAPTPEIKERYWTVFEPNAFERLLQQSTESSARVSKQRSVRSRMKNAWSKRFKVAQADIISDRRPIGDSWQVNIRWLLLPVAASFVHQLASVAEEHSVPSPIVATSRQSAPSIRFLRPIRGEHFSDFPVFVQVDVAGFHLLPPEKQHSKTLPANTGYIRYSMDDFPVYGGDDTQVMIGKFIGDRYIPVGWHVLKAELVDVNGNPLSPPVKAETATFSSHPPSVETDHVQTGSMQAELNAQELYKMRLQLQEMQQELTRIKTGNSGFVPVPGHGEDTRGE